MVQRTGEQGQGNILFVQNNFYYDAFFMKAIGECFVWLLFLESWLTWRVLAVLNGVCTSGWCTGSNGEQYHVSSILLQLSK